ncbi:MAG: response regulator transcription factor [Thermodesulfobacteriota bacterium]
MTESWRLVIAEDHTIIREGLRALLATDPGFDIVGEAADGLDAVKSVEALRPDLVIMDLSMPKMNGVGAIREIKRVAPDTKIVVLTVHKNEEYILASFKAGANGYVLKYATHEELVSAIRTVLRGQPYLSPAVSAVVLEGYLQGQEKPRPDSSLGSLTARETDVLKLIAEGYKNKQIAELLGISVKTVERHRANLMKKLDLHNGPALTAFAVEKGLISTNRTL